MGVVHELWVAKNKKNADTNEKRSKSEKNEIRQFFFSSSPDTTMITGYYYYNYNRLNLDKKINRDVAGMVRTAVVTLWYGSRLGDMVKGTRYPRQTAAVAHIIDYREN